MKIINETQDSSFRTASGYTEFVKDGKTSLTENGNKKLKVQLKRKKIK
jgi:hypothetical protein